MSLELLFREEGMTFFSQPWLSHLLDHRPGYLPTAALASNVVSTVSSMPGQESFLLASGQETCLAARRGYLFGVRFLAGILVSSAQFRYGNLKNVTQLCALVATVMGALEASQRQ